MAKLEITQVKSGIGRHKNQQNTLRSLGLKKIGQTTVREDTSIVKGMVNTVSHLVDVREVK